MFRIWWVVIVSFHCWLPRFYSSFSTVSAWKNPILAIRLVAIGSVVTGAMLLIGKSRSMFHTCWVCYILPCVVTHISSALFSSNEDAVPFNRDPRRVSKVSKSFIVCWSLCLLIKVIGHFKGYVWARIFPGNMHRSLSSCPIANLHSGKCCHRL